jgi:predicted nucleotidyltransferase component of viral defense system
MSLGFIDEVSRIRGIQRRDLVEKDLLLHRLLRYLSLYPEFSENYLFKGGTCLIKCHLGYYRFSEDVDFTWLHQNRFEGKSQKRLRRILSGIIDELGLLLEGFAREEGMDFICDKSNREFVELGGGNKTCTFKLWYTSEILETRSFVKVQVNYVERLCHSPVNMTVRCVVGEPTREMRLLFPEVDSYSEPLKLWAYDIPEILCEKARAILTRMAVKARDFVDVYMIEKETGVNLIEHLDCAVEKLRFMLELYQKYRENLAGNLRLLESGELFRWGEEKTLLLRDIDEGEFYDFISPLENLLKKIVETVE